MAKGGRPARLRVRDSRMNRLIVTVLTVLAVAGVARAGAFEDGLAAFRRAAAVREKQGEGSPEAKARFREAAERWEGLADSGTVSAHLFTNIGNARAFAGDLGPAVLAYRRALVLDPKNERAARSLEAVRKRIGLEAEGDSASTGLLRALFFWHHTLSFGSRWVLFAAFWLGAWVLVLAARRRRRLRFPAALALVVAVALLTSLAVDEGAAADHEGAVLITRTEGRTGDGEVYSPSHTAPLPAGAELDILERRGSGWIHGRLRDGSDTWVRADAVAAVVP